MDWNEGAVQVYGHAPELIGRTSEPIGHIIMGGRRPKLGTRT